MDIKAKITAVTGDRRTDRPGWTCREKREKGMRGVK
jgi:hypothetical protein